MELKMAKKKDEEEPIVIEDDPKSYLGDTLLNIAVQIAVVAIPQFPQRNPERVSEFAVETARQILERCDPNE
jgi:hypothetical protein